MSQVTEQSVRFQSALASIKLIHASVVFDVTEDDYNYTLSLHDALPICRPRSRSGSRGRLPNVRWRARCREDRKSTRLNSSHMSKSYAVFCLKKKILNNPYVSRPLWPLLSSFRLLPFWI